MKNEELQELIGSWSPNLTFAVEGSQYLNVSVPIDELHDIMFKLKHNDQTNLDYLFCLSGVDWGEELGVVYHLESTNFRHSLVVKTQTAERSTLFDGIAIRHFNRWRQNVF